MAEQGQGGEARLQPGLKRRHMTMISLGGIIGAGLFVGAGAIINEAGPAAVLTYAMTGVVVILIMRMLGEMSAAEPSVGSFSDYSRSALGDWAGFTVGWLYWYFWVVVVGVEAVAGAGIIAQYLPDAPQWLLCLILTMLLTATNLYSVGSYGEFEYWFAGIKVVAIIIFIVVGAAFLFGLFGDSPGLSNLYANGGFAPAGGLTVFSGITTVIFAFVGAEIVTIAAAESSEPERGVARATNAVVYRIFLFYVLSVFLVVAIVPWDTPFTEDVIASPFAVALGAIGIPGAALIMNLVVLTAVLSVLNSSLYTSSRMLFALTRHGDAPRFFTNTTRRGVPIWAILVGTVFGYVAVVMNYVSPDTVFSFLLNSSGAVALLVYLLIAVSELVMRQRLEREAPERLRVKMWLYPWLTILTIVAILAVLVAMAFTEGAAIQLYLTLVALVIILIAYFVKRAVAGRAEPVGE